MAPLSPAEVAAFSREDLEEHLLTDLLKLQGLGSYHEDFDCWKRWWPCAGDTEKRICIFEDHLNTDWEGARIVWPAGLVLARMFEVHSGLQQELQGKTVVELGAGCALLSMTCAMQGAAKVLPAPTIALHHTTGYCLARAHCRLRWYGMDRGFYPPPPPCNSHALVQAAVRVGTAFIWYVILIRYQMYCSHIRHWFGDEFASYIGSWTHLLSVGPLEPTLL